MTSTQKPKLSLFYRTKRFLSGIIAGNADNDPAAITAYSIGGATTGYSQLWLMVLAAPMLIVVQSMCARIADVTHQGLGAVIKEHFPKPVAYFTIFVLLITTIIAIGADLAGIGAAFQLIFNVRLTLWIVPVALAIWMVVLFTDFESITKFLFGVVIFFFTYIISAFMSKPDWVAVGKNLFFPTVRLEPGFITSAVGILGATLTPSVFFWQAEEELEEKDIDKEEKLHKMNLMLAPGFIFAQSIVVFIMIATAATLHAHHIGIKTAADAAKALEPFAGAFAKYLFAVGIIGAGLIAVPVMAASAGYMVAELFNWRQSLSAQIDQAKGFYIVITLALFTGVEIALSEIDPIKALFYSQMLAGIVCPILIILLLILSNRKNIMGEHANGWFDNLFGIVSVFVMISSVILLFFQGGSK